MTEEFKGMDVSGFPDLRKLYAMQMALELSSVQPIAGEGWKKLMEFFERNPGMGFYFVSRKENK